MPSPSPQTSPIPSSTPDDDIETEFAITETEERNAVKCFDDEKACESRLQSCATMPAQDSSPILNWFSRIGLVILGLIVGHNI